MSETRDVLRLAQRPRWLGYLALIALFAVAAHFLAQWQLARRAEAQAEIARIDANYDAEPAEIAEVLPTHDYWDESLRWTPVALEGSYLAAGEVLVRNRPYGGQSGYLVITPFHLNDGSVLFINRGWVAAGDKVNEPSQFEAPPVGEITITARLLGSEVEIPDRETQGNLVPSIHLPSLAQQVPAEGQLREAVYTGAYGVISAEPVPNTYPVPAGKPERDEGPHLSYALQWYAFPLIALAGWFWALRNEVRRGEVLEPTHRTHRTAKRKSDSEIEDALLDR